MPMTISTITFTSCRFKSMTFSPSSPATYVISTPTAGSTGSISNSSLLTTFTIGVVISTLAFSIVETAVADAPRLILSISPIASISILLKCSELIVTLLSFRDNPPHSISRHPARSAPLSSLR